MDIIPQLIMSELGGWGGRSGGGGGGGIANGTVGHGMYRSICVATKATDGNYTNEPTSSMQVGSLSPDT